MAAKSKATENASEKKARAKQKPSTLAVKVVPNITSDTPTYYVNYADIGHSANEFSFVALRVPARVTNEQKEEATKTGSLVVEAVVQLLFPPSLMPGLEKAVAIQIAKYEQTHGKIKREEEKK